MPYLAWACNTCDRMVQEPGPHGPEDDYCEGEQGYDRIELFTQQEVDRRVSVASNESHWLEAIAAAYGDRHPEAKQYDREEIARAAAGRARRSFASALPARQADATNRPEQAAAPIQPAHIGHTSTTPSEPPPPGHIRLDHDGGSDLFTSPDDAA